jgi:cyclopropane fatty-acyl-phospholipid synthase-like methyltransferase
MAVRIDPNNSDSRALLAMVDLSGQHVLEIGCGDGRFTWRYADRAGRVSAIEPSAVQLALAGDQMPGRLQDRIEFHNIAFEDFASASKRAVFDIVILSWSLC